MVFRLSLERCTPIGQYAKQRHLVLFEEWQDPIIKDVRRRDSMLGFIAFCEGDPGIGIDEGLLVDPAHAFYISNVVRILGSQISGMFSFYFPQGLPLLLFAFHGYHLLR